MTYRVKLDVFEGPIDLLLNLITRQRVDIYEVSLASITEEYLGAVRALPATDLDTATGFLVVAATLLELKSARLLPVHRSPGEGDDGLLEARDLLLARLVECSTFRTAGQWIGAGLAAGARMFPREVGLEPRFLDLAPDIVVEISPEQLAEIAGSLLAQPPAPDVEVAHVAPSHLSVRAAIEELAAELAARETASFSSLCPPRASRAAVVVRFLALLELYKAGVVELRQAERFGDIEALWTGQGDVFPIDFEADEYASPAGGGEASGRAPSEGTAP